MDYYLREPDRGLYDAMNKGVSTCTGDVICFLHSDDVFHSPEAVANVAKVSMIVDVI